MFSHSTKTRLSITTAIMIALSACADNGSADADDIATGNAADNIPATVETTVAVPVDLETVDFDSVNPDADLYGARETTMERNVPNDKLIKVRKVPLDAKQAVSRQKIDVRQQAKDVKVEVDAVCANKVKLVDPAYDGAKSFATVDRNNDGSLSPAEFAIYDLANINPLVKCDKDDGTRPFVSTKALNMSADDFVRADTNGDVAISKEEFAAIN